MTATEWYALHGYDEQGVPKQRFTWEAIATGVAPHRAEEHSRVVHIWIRDRQKKSGGLVARLTSYADNYELSIGSSRSSHRTEVTVTRSETSYAEAVKMAYAVFMMTRKDTHDQA